MSFGYVLTVCVIHVVSSSNKGTCQGLMCPWPFQWLLHEVFFRDFILPSFFLPWDPIVESKIRVLEVWNIFIVLLLRHRIFADILDWRVAYVIGTNLNEGRQKYMFIDVKLYTGTLKYNNSCCVATSSWRDRCFKRGMILREWAWWLLPSFFFYFWRGLHFLNYWSDFKVFSTRKEL